MCMEGNDAFILIFFEPQFPYMCMEGNDAFIIEYLEAWIKYWI